MAQTYFKHRLLSLKGAKCQHFQCKKVRRRQKCLLEKCTHNKYACGNVLVYEKDENAAKTTAEDGRRSAFFGGLKGRI